MNQVRHLQSGFESFKLSQIPKSRNTHADSLATLAISSAQRFTSSDPCGDFCKPIEVGRNAAHVHQIRVGPSWMDTIVLFLKKDILPKEKSKADKVRRKAHWF